MKKIIAILIITLLMGGVSSVHAQKKPKDSKKDAYHITFILESIDDTMLYVASYYADKTYMFDSIRVSEPHTYVLKGDITLPRGIYVLAGQNKNKYMDFVVDSSVFFTIRVEGTDFINNVTYIGSPENEQACDFFKHAGYFQGKMYELRNDIKTMESAAKPNAKEIKSAKDLMIRYQDSLDSYIADFVVKYGDKTLFGRIQKFAQDVEVPDPPKGNKDSNYAYHYYVNHYWDNCDFNEQAMAYTPIFQPRIDKFFKTLPPLVDTIIKYADQLLDKMKDNPEMFKYAVWFITNKYERSEYVGHDEIFVHMVQTYYAQGRCPWTNEAVLERMVDRANVLDKILVGRPCPELWMFDTNDRFISNYSFNTKYTIMWFWDVDCGHCKSATPTLVEFYNRAKKDLDFEVYAVCMGSDVGKWKKAIVERQLPFVNVGGNKANLDFREVFDIRTTPQIFVLDKDKKIIAKKIGVESLEQVIRDYEAGKRIR